MLANFIARRAPCFFGKQRSAVKRDGLFPGYAFAVQGVIRLARIVSRVSGSVFRIAVQSKPMPNSVMADERDFEINGDMHVQKWFGFSSGDMHRSLDPFQEAGSWANIIRRKTPGAQRRLVAPSHLIEDSVALENMDGDKIEYVIAHMILHGGIAADVLANFRKDFVPRTADLLEQIAPQRSEMFAKAFRVRPDRSLHSFALGKLIDAHAFPLTLAPFAFAAHARPPPRSFDNYFRHIGTHIKSGMVLYPVI